MAVVTDMYIIKNDGISDNSIIAYINLLEKKGIVNLSVNDTSACYKAVATFLMLR